MKTKHTLKVVLLSILCFVLTAVLGAGILSSVAARRSVKERVLTAAIEKFPLEELNINGEPAAEFILREFIADERVKIESVERVMREGTFSSFAAKTMDKYGKYLTDGGALPKLEQDDFVGLIEENQELIRRETGLEFLEPDKEKLHQNLQLPLEAWNVAAYEVLGRGVTSFCIKAFLSIWMPVVLGVLLLAVLAWMICFYVRGGFTAGAAIRVYSIALFVPCLVLFGGLVLIDAFAKIPFLRDSMGMLYVTLLPIAGVGGGVCTVLFIISLVCSSIEKKKIAELAGYGGDYEKMYTEYGEIPVYVPETSEPSASTMDTAVPEISEPDGMEISEPDEPEQARQYCRDCGQPLVNPNAKFCYKCGSVQEQVHKN